MAAKYKEFVDRMIETNKELFEKFETIHHKYALSQEAHQGEFNKIGGEVMEVVREFEDKLCNRSESNGYGKYSSNLAEKFQNEVRKLYPHIDSVGIIRTIPAVEEEFVINKISPK